jgi:ornithine--oxo-acid transaminase
VSAVVSRREVLACSGRARTATPFGGNPAETAPSPYGGFALQDEHLVERSAELGAMVLEQVRTIRHPRIKAVRRGLMVAIELDENPSTASAQGRGMLCKETHDYVIRLSPPLVVSREDLAGGSSCVPCSPWRMTGADRSMSPCP